MERGAWSGEEQVRNQQEAGSVGERANFEWRMASAREAAGDRGAMSAAARCRSISRGWPRGVATGVEARSELRECERQRAAAVRRGAEPP